MKKKFFYHGAEGVLPLQRGLGKQFQSTFCLGLNGSLLLKVPGRRCGSRLLANLDNTKNMKK